MAPLKVAIAGSTGKVGRELVKAFLREQDLQLVGATGRTGVGQDAGLFCGGPEAGVKIVPRLADALELAAADVVVDFTRADVARENILLCLERRIPLVVGTTGFSADDLRQFETLAFEQGVGVALISNFAIGVMLMNRFAEQARRFFAKVDIREMHHETKVDAPSGTALRLAERIRRAGGDEPTAIPIHSQRLPGAVAHHEVVFGGQGQLLTIRHDSISRESFVPGVLLAVRRIASLRGVVYDLDELVTF